MTETDAEFVNRVASYGVGGMLSKAEFDELIRLARRSAAVPDNMTPEMFKAAYTAYHNEEGAGFYDAYRAMLAAALKDTTNEARD